MPNSLEFSSTQHWSLQMPTTFRPFAALSAALAISAFAAAATTLAAQAPSKPAPESAATALDDPTIVAIFDNANTADIETGKLAAKRGHSEEVRQFGAMLARDHEMVRQQGRDLAKKLGVTPTPPAGDKSAQDQAAVISRLSALKGAEFDRAFLQREVQFHKDVIAAVSTTLLPAIKNQELKALVVKVAPAFQAHQQMAENLGKQLAGK
jgi:putative membrane protein